MPTITISKKRIRKDGGVVVLSIEEYRRLSERATPAYYLKGKAAKKLDKMVEEGLGEYRAGKAKTLKSLADLD